MLCSIVFGGSWCYKWCAKQHNITVAGFQQKCCFQQQMLFFRKFFDFCLNKTIFTWKINIYCWKTTLLLKTSNNDAMFLTATNIASGAHDDNWNQNPSEILRFSKNLDFWQILKIDFEHHICCHVYGLSNITIWQHISGGLVWQHISNKCCFPTAPQFNIHLWCRFFFRFW